MNADVEKILRKTPLFASLSEKEMEALTKHVTTQRSERGELLFSEGEPWAGLLATSFCHTESSMNARRQP
jgi:hypothetical protein